MSPRYCHNKWTFCTDRWWQTSMALWWNGNWQEKAHVLGTEKLTQDHTVLHKSHKHWFGIEPSWSLRWETGVSRNLLSTKKERERETDRKTTKHRRYLFHLNTTDGDDFTRLLSVLTLWCRNYFFLILAHPVYKMWIIQEPNKLALWNKLHFEEKKTESIEHV